MRKIVLSVSSAKVVNTNHSHAYGMKKKYRETIGRNGTPIESINDMDNIIHINHILNALHVMFGARPVSFKYGNHNQLSQKIIDIVENGIMRYDNVYTGEITYKNGDIKTVFYNEFTQGKKPFKNSNRNGLLTTASDGDEIPAYITWSTVYKNSLYNENMRNVLKIIKEYSEFIHCDNIVDKYTFIDILTDIKYNNPEWIERFKEIPNIATILNFFKGNNKGSGFNHIDSYNLAGLGNINAPTPKVSVNATIILFMEDEDAERLLNGKRYATILDNGFIYLANDYNNEIITNIRDFDIVTDIKDYIEDYLDEGFIEIKNLPYTNGTTKN